MATEHYVDRVENLRLQGPVITLSFVRVQSAEPDQEAPDRRSCQIDNDHPKYGEHDQCVNPSLAADVIGVSDQPDAIGRSVFCVAISICVAVFKCAAIAVAVLLSHRFDNGGKVMRATLSIQMTELVQYKLRFSNHLMIRDRN